MTARLSPNFLLTMLFIVITLLGCVFRFTNLGYKEYFHDEGMTLLSVSGKKYVEFAAFTGNSLRQFGDLQPFQSPAQGLDLIACLKAVTTNDPDHPPLFYLLAHLWCCLLGNASSSMRLLPALLSLLALPCTYWLARELSFSRLNALFAVAMVALSPIFVYHAQDLREYSFVVALQIALTACLCKALRERKSKSWLLYGSLLTLAMYTNMIVFEVIIGHALFVFTDVRGKQRKNFLLAVLISLALFLPWLAAIASQGGFYFTSWTAEPVPLNRLILGWISQLSCPVFDLGYLNHLFRPVQWIIAAGAVLAVISAVASGSRNFRILLSIAIVNFLLTGLVDLLFGGQRSIPLRFHFDIFILVIFALAQCGQRRLSLIAFVFALQLSSSAYLLNCPIWPNDTMKDRWLNPVASILNAETAPLIVSELLSQPSTAPAHSNITLMMCLSHLIKKDARLEFIWIPEKLYIPPGIDHFYAFNVTDNILNQARSNGYSVCDVPNIKYLKKLTKQ